MATGKAVRTRKSALKLATWDPALLWYAKAVAAMKALPMTDPTSWGYQAAIHGFTLDPNEDEFAAAFWNQVTAGQKLPNAAAQKKFWRKCQHGSWYFLPWHRMYLGFFEKIAGKIITDLGGPADWALPYWDYNEGSTSRKLPRAFTSLEPKLPDGTTNPLIEPSRDHGNDGKAFLVANRVSINPAFDEHQFTSGAHGGTQGFGGPVTLFHHSGGSHGGLESQPHDQVHDMVGGAMGDPVTAGYDPIFWLHHANIDRLWEVWLNADSSNQNPPASSKWQKFVFTFNDDLGKTPSLTPQDVLDTKSKPFYYEYEDIAVPAGFAKPAVARAPRPKAPMAEEPMAEMAGASSEPIPLTGEAKTLSVRLFPATGPSLALGAQGARFQKAYLHVENIRGKGRPPSYDIYLNAPRNAQQQPEQYRAGNIPTFGLEQASAATEDHPGNGLRYSFNVTRIVNRLKEENRWDSELLKVTFVPTRAPARGSSIEVGRVSLYFA
jgi:tyrosinase